MAATTVEDKKKGFITDITMYSKCKNDIYKKIDERLRKSDRFQMISERKEESEFDMELSKKLSKGKFWLIIQNSHTHPKVVAEHFTGFLFYGTTNVTQELSKHCELFSDFYNKLQLASLYCFLTVSLRSHEAFIGK